MKDVELIRSTKAALEYHEREGNVLCVEHFKKQLGELNEEVPEQSREK